MHRLYTAAAVAACALLGLLAWALFDIGFLAAFGAALAVVIVGTVVVVLRDERPRASRLRGRGEDP